MFSKKIAISLLFTLLSITLLAQSPLKVSGVIIDADSEEPVPFAQVALYAPNGEVPITGTTTKENGSFQIQAEPGEYDLAVVFVGYEEKKITNVKLEGGSTSLGNIQLFSKAQKLEEVVVKGEAVRRPVTTDLEGLNIRPDQTLSNVGGNVLDVLRNTPSVNVGQDGAVSLRGSSATNILIDGRNSALAADLEQIPASMVKNIKIVNNPNAKYDAQGEGGVINIQLKQAEELGTSGKAELSLGTRYRFNSSLRLSHRTKKYNVYGGYSYRRWPSVGFFKTTRQTFDDNQRLEQFSDRSREDSEHTVNYGGDYFVGKNKFSYEGAVNFENENDFEAIQAQLFNTADNSLINQYLRNNNETEDNYTLDNALIYERLFDDKREFRATLSHSYRDQLENQRINVYRDVITAEGGNVDGQERALNDEFNETIVIQADYAQPFSNGKIETGYKSTIRTLENDYLYERLNSATNQWENQTDISNRFRYAEQVHALYAIYSHTFDKLKIAVGSRLEQTLVETRLFNTGEKNDQRYLNLFPSLQAQYDLDDKNTLKFTYSRRIDRPNSWYLNPFPDVADSLNIRIGNANIQPEFINSFEVGHRANFKKADITTNFFYRHVNGQVDWIIDVRDGVSYRQPTNLNTSMTYGFEVISSWQILPWWNMNASYSLFQINVDGTNVNEDFSNDGVAWNTKVTTDFDLPLGFDLQLTGNYTAPEIEAQGRDLARYYLDVSLQRSFLDDRGSINLSFRDIFDTRNFRGENFSPRFSQVFEYKRESQIFMASLSYTL